MCGSVGSSMFQFLVFLGFVLSETNYEGSNPRSVKEKLNTQTPEMTKQCIGKK